MTSQVVVVAAWQRTVRALLGTAADADLRRDVRRDGLFGRHRTEEEAANVKKIRAAEQRLNVARAHALTFEALAAREQSALKVANSRERPTRTAASSPG